MDDLTLHLLKIVLKFALAWKFCTLELFVLELKKFEDAVD